MPEKEETVAVGTLEAFVAAVLNIQLVEVPTEPAEEKKVVTSANSPGTAPPAGPTEEQKGKEAVRTLTNEEIQRVRKEFALLYLNRTSNGPSQKRQGAQEPSFQFKPSICEESVRLASSGREKYVRHDVVPAEEKKEESTMRKDNISALADVLINQKRNQEE